MTLAEVSEISQTLASAAIVASLIFVGIQIRQDTKATQAESHYAVSKALNQINLLWARNAEVTRIWLVGLRDRGALTPEERWRFDSTVRAYLHVCETMYTQADLGAGDCGIVLAEENGIKTVFSSVGVKQWWAENPFGFSGAFRNYIDKLTGPRPLPHEVNDAGIGRDGNGKERVVSRVNQLLLQVSRAIPFRSNLDVHLIRGAMVFIFFIFSIQKWNPYTAQMLAPLISHSPVVFWLLPAFGVRGAGYFLGTTETIFGSLIFLGFWSPRLGILGALGSIVTFIGTTGIIAFLPGAWAREGGGFPIMTLPLGFLMKDVLFLAASFYLLKQDLMRAAEAITGGSPT